MHREKTFFENFHTYVDHYRGYEDRSIDDLFSEIQEGTAYLTKSDKILILQAYEF
jgi:hypothetical protein